MFKIRAFQGVEIVKEMGPFSDREEAVGRAQELADEMDGTAQVFVEDAEEVEAATLHQLSPPEWREQIPEEEERLEREHQEFEQAYSGLPKWNQGPVSRAIPTTKAAFIREYHKLLDAWAGSRRYLGAGKYTELTEPAVKAGDRLADMVEAHSGWAQTASDQWGADQQREAVLLNPIDQPTPEHFRMILVGDLTRYDRRLERTQPNIYRLAHYLGGAEKVMEAVPPELHKSSSKEAAQAMLDALPAGFTTDFSGRLSLPPVERTAAKIRAWRDHGALPRYANPEEWLQEADEEIEEAGTEGAFTKQARRAGYTDTLAFARAVMAGWRSGEKKVYNKKTRKKQGITKKTMYRANFAINAQKRRRNPKWGQEKTPSPSNITEIYKWGQGGPETLWVHPQGRGSTIPLTLLEEKEAAEVLERNGINFDEIDWTTMGEGKVNFPSLSHHRAFSITVRLFPGTYKSGPLRRNPHSRERESFTNKVDRVLRTALGEDWDIDYEGTHDYDGGAWVAFYTWPEGEESFQDHPGLEEAAFEEAVGKAAKAIAGIEKGSSVERKPGEWSEYEGVTVVVPSLGGRFHLNGESNPDVPDWSPYINVMGEWGPNRNPSTEEARSDLLPKTKETLDYIVRYAEASRDLFPDSPASAVRHAIREHRLDERAAHDADMDRIRPIAIRIVTQRWNRKNPRPVDPLEIPAIENPVKLLSMRPPPGRHSWSSVPPKVGDILVSSWGYDQTNVDFYQIVKTTPTQVVVCELESRIVRTVPGSDYVIPVPDECRPGRDTLRRKWREYGGGIIIDIQTYSMARSWDGKPQRQTAAGYGHN